MTCSFYYTTDSQKVSQTTDKTTNQTTKVKRLLSLLIWYSYKYSKNQNDKANDKGFDKPNDNANDFFNIIGLNKNIRKKLKNIYIYIVNDEFFLIFLNKIQLKIFMLKRFLQRIINIVFYRQKQALFSVYPLFVYNYTLRKKSPLKLIYDGFINIRFFNSVRNVRLD